MAGNETSSNPNGVRMLTFCLYWIAFTDSVEDLWGAILQLCEFLGDILACSKFQAKRTCRSGR